MPPPPHRVRALLGQQRLDDPAPCTVPVDPQDLGLVGRAQVQRRRPARSQLRGPGQAVEFLTGAHPRGHQSELQGEFGPRRPYRRTHGLAAGLRQRHRHPVGAPGQLQRLQMVQHPVRELRVARRGVEVDPRSHLLDHGSGVDLRAQRQQHRLALKLLDQRLDDREALHLRPARHPRLTVPGHPPDRPRGAVHRPHHVPAYMPHRKTHRSNPFKLTEVLATLSGEGGPHPAPRPRLSGGSPGTGRCTRLRGRALARGGARGDWP